MIKYRIILLLFIVWIPYFIYGQKISITTHIPKSFPDTKSIDVEVIIEKDTLTSMAKYYFEVPNGYQVSGEATYGGFFLFENQQAKWLWAKLPRSKEIVLKFKIIQEEYADKNAVFYQRFFYVVNQIKKEYKAEPIMIGANNYFKISQADTTSPGDTVIHSQKTNSFVYDIKEISYKIQIGAYKVKPQASDFKKLDQPVEIIQEQDDYKVMYGNCANRVDVDKLLIELKRKGYNGFVVPYKNGKRIK